MLIEFRVKNHRSLRDEQILTMEAGRVAGNSLVPRTAPGFSQQLLPVAAIYGANASGKSNVLDAITFMRKAVVQSLGNWGPYGEIPRKPFAWGNSQAESSLYEVSILVNSIRYEYGFVVSDTQVEEEWLYAYPKGRRQVWFERDKKDFKYGDHFGSVPSQIEALNLPHVLFLSHASQFAFEQLHPVQDWFRDLIPLNLNMVEEGGVEYFTTHSVLSETFLHSLPGDPYNQRTRSGRYDKPESTRGLISELRDWMRQADVGVYDVIVDDDERLPLAGEVKIPLTKPEWGAPYFRHDKTAENSWLPWIEESEGTRQLYDISLPILLGLRSGGVVVFDELESSLHPAIAQEIVRKFNDPKTNPHNAQLIFTTHDTNLLGNTVGEPVLRRDQVWLTEKDKSGATTLYPLTDVKPRKEENLERGYLQGRYGAIPFLGAFKLTGED